MITELRASIESIEEFDSTQRASLMKAAKGLERKGAHHQHSELSMSAPGIYDDGHWDDPAMLINFSNGTLHLPDVELRPHASVGRLTKILPYDYDPSAECPNFEKVLADVLEPDVVPISSAAFGYALWGQRAKSTLSQF